MKQLINIGPVLLCLFCTIYISCKKNYDGSEFAAIGEYLDTIFDRAYSIELSEPDSALIMYKKAYQIAVDSNLVQYKGRSLYYQGLVHYDQGDFGRAKEHYNQSLEVFEGSSDDENVLKVSNALGNLYNQQGVHDSAIAYFHQALDKSKALNLYTYQMIIIGNLATVYETAHQDDQATQIILQGLELAPLLDDQMYVADLLNNLSQLYVKHQHLDSAILTISRAIQIYRKADNGKYVSMAQANLIGYLLDEDSLNGSRIKRLLDSVEQLLELYPDPRNNLNYCVQRHKYNISTDNLSDALVSAQSLEEALEVFPEARSELKYNQLQYELYKKLGNSEVALDYLEKWKVQLDSMVYDERKNELMELQARYESSEKDVLLLNQLVEIKDRKNQRDRAYLLGLIFLGLGTLLFYRNRTNQKLAASKIESLERLQRLMALDYMVQGQEEERKRIALDLHDGIGALLTTARLQIQNVRSEISRLGQINPLNKTERLIVDACSEVRRISHDMMPGALMNLGLIDALEDLAQQFMSEHKILIVIDDATDGVVLDDLQRVQLYRICQELLNNSVKHADAQNISIEIFDEDNKLILSYRDDGKGFDADAVLSKGGMGLQNIRSRVQYLNGLLKLSSEENQGVQYEISFRPT